MSQIERRTLKVGDVAVLARLCELRKLESRIEGETSFALRSRDQLLRDIGDRDSFKLSLLRKSPRQVINLTVDRGQFQTSFDSDIQWSDGITVVDMLFNRKDVNLPGDAYLQAAACEEAAKQGLSFLVDEDYLVDGSLCVGEVTIELAQDETSSWLGASTV